MTQLSVSLHLAADVRSPSLYFINWGGGVSTAFDSLILGGGGGNTETNDLILGVSARGGGVNTASDGLILGDWGGGGVNAESDDLILGVSARGLGLTLRLTALFWWVSAEGRGGNTESFKARYFC